MRHLTPFLFIIAVGCASNHTGEVTPTVLRVGVLPDQTENVLHQRYASVLWHLQLQTGVACELIVPGSYSELVDAFTRREIDLAYFGGVTFVRAHRTAGAIPLVMRARDLRFTSAFLVRADDPATSIEELRHRRIAFGSRLSTSGHLMPRHHLKRWNVEPEQFFSEVHYTGAHDATAYWVRDTRADVGVANTVVVTSMLADGRLSPQDVRVLRETPPYANYVWAVQPDITPAIRAQLRDAFLTLSSEDPDDAVVLQSLGGAYFIPAHIEYFEDLMAILEQLAPLGSHEGV